MCTRTQSTSFIILGFASSVFMKDDVNAFTHWLVIEDVRDQQVTNDNVDIMCIFYKVEFYEVHLTQV